MIRTNKTMHARDSISALIENGRVIEPTAKPTPLQRATLPFAILAGLAFAAPAIAKPWKGAEMITKSEFKYGAFESRIRGAEGSGMVTAFFMWKNDSELAHTEWQEQDFELFGKDGTYQTQVMTPGDPRTENKRYHKLPTANWENYYTYRMEWTPNYVAFYVDGRLVRKETDPIRYGKLLDPARAEPAQLRLSLWAGDWSWSGAFDESKVPATTFVEYTEVSRYTPGAGPGGSDFTPIWRDDFESINNNRWWFANWTFEYAVNDYTPRNATTIDGKLALTLTSWQNEGQFPNSAPADNPVVEPLPEPTTPTPSPNPTPTPQEPDADYVPVSVPGRVEAETVRNFRDTSAGNKHDAACSVTDMDAELTSDAGGGCNISEVSAGEWTEYEVIADQAGTYTATLRVATARTGTAMHLEVNGEDATGRVSVPARGWQSFSNVPVTVTLAEGSNIVRAAFDTAWTNLNYIDFDLLEAVEPEPTPEEPVDETPVEEPVDETPEEPVDETPVEEPVDETPVEEPVDETPAEEPAGYTPVTIPGRVEAENVSAYYDTTPGNKHHAVCGETDLDLEISKDVGGGCHVGETRPSEWTEYVINVPQEGTYNAILRVATGYSSRAVRMQIDGKDVAPKIAVPQIGWQSFVDEIVPVSLTEGEHTVRIYYDTGMVNLNYIDFE